MDLSYQYFIQLGGMFKLKQPTDVTLSWLIYDVFYIVLVVKLPGVVV